MGLDSGIPAEVIGTEERLDRRCCRVLPIRFLKRIIERNNTSLSRIFGILTAVDSAFTFFPLSGIQTLHYPAAGG